MGSLMSFFLGLVIGVIFCVPLSALFHKIKDWVTGKMSK